MQASRKTSGCTLAQHHGHYKCERMRNVVVLYVPVVSGLDCAIYASAVFIVNVNRFQREGF